jgi:hypothetical protein
MDKNSLASILYSFIHPTQLVVILRDIFKLSHKQFSNKMHLESAMLWLCRSQDRWESGGCAATFGFYSEWGPPYPETTGYIISTFLKYAIFSDDERFRERAKRMGDWEIELQLPSGAVKGGFGDYDYPIVFNTGMVILGWTDLYNSTMDKRFIEAAVKAGDWLCSIIDEDGKWSKFEYKEIPHTYSSRVAWSLLEIFKHTGNAKYKDAAILNLKWVLSKVKENGWIEEMGFYKGDINPLTHTIAYTLRGLLESSSFCEVNLKAKLQGIVMHASDKLIQWYEGKNSFPDRHIKLLPGRFDENWQPAVKYSCLTGNAQMAIIWLKLYQLSEDQRYLKSARELLHQLKKAQNIKSSNPGINGGIAGSYPIWGDYMRFSYPNWAVKFYADALMLLETINKENG